MPILSSTKRVVTRLEIDIQLVILQQVMLSHNTFLLMRQIMMIRTKIKTPITAPPEITSDYEKMIMHNMRVLHTHYATPDLQTYNASVSLCIITISHTLPASSHN